MRVVLGLGDGAGGGEGEGGGESYNKRTGATAWMLPDNPALVNLQRYWYDDKRSVAACSASSTSRTSRINKGLRLRTCACAFVR